MTLHTAFTCELACQVSVDFSSQPTQVLLIGLHISTVTLDLTGVESFYYQIRKITVMLTNEE